MISIAASALEKMKQDGIQTFPDECCGFILGKEDDSQRTVQDVLVVNNSKEGDKRRRFEITAEDYLKAERYADESQLDLLGVYHSHPNHPSIPSETDRLSAQPNFSYLILSVYDKEFRSVQSWRLNEERQFEEEKILLQSQSIQY